MQKTPSGSLDRSLDLPDVNIWLALAIEDHPAHARALQYWRTEAATRVAFCRTTVLGLVRLATNRAVMRGQPLDPSDAWAAYQSFRRLPEVQLAHEPTGSEASLAGWVQKGLVTAGLWTDAYLAAFATSGGMRLVTLDRDFTRFKGLDALILRP